MKNLTTEKKGNKFLMIFQSPIENPVLIVSEIVRRFFNRNKENFRIIAPDPMNVTRNMIYSWIQFCGKPRQDRVIYCSFGIFSNRSLMTDNKRPSEPCTVEALHPNCPPYTSFVKGEDQIKGIEENIIDTFASILHFNIVYIVSQNFGAVYSNGVMTENFLSLKNDLADILFGGCAMSESRMKHLGSTVNYLEKELSWCAPVKPISSYDKVFENALSGPFVISGISLCLSASFVLWYISNLERRELQILKLL